MDLNRIKEVMEDAYKDGKLSPEKRQMTLEAIRKRKSTINNIPIVVVLFIAVLILLISTIIRPAEKVEYVSSVNVETNFEDVFMERILKGFNISTEAQLEQYLSESDWLLQRALESGESIFYRTPELNQWEREDLAALLHYLYIWRDTNGIKALPFETVTTFSKVVKEAPFYVKVLSDFFEGEPYLTSLGERGNIPVTYFEAMTKGNQFGLIGIMVFFVILFIRNMKQRTNLLFRLIPTFIIIMCIVPFVSRVEKDYAYDETTLLQVAEEQLGLEGGAIENAATFGNARYALFTVGDTRHMATFRKDMHGYRFFRSEGGSSWVKFDDILNGSKEGFIMVAGFFKGHPYSKVELINDEGQVFAISVTPGESAIKKVSVPKGSYKYYYYDEKGNEIK